jgi:hypothetical protein
MLIDRSRARPVVAPVPERPRPPFRPFGEVFELAPESRFEAGAGLRFDIQSPSDVS